MSEDGSFVLPSTDEFGGYSKHGYTGLDSISAALGIDIDSKIRELHLDLGRVSGEEKGRGRSSSEKAHGSKEERRQSMSAKKKRKSYQKFKTLVMKNKENIEPQRMTAY